jgi:hypothetical protein
LIRYYVDQKLTIENYEDIHILFVKISIELKNKICLEILAFLKLQYGVKIDINELKFAHIYNLRAYKIKNIKSKDSTK